MLKETGTYVQLQAGKERERDIGAITLQVNGCYGRRASEVPEKSFLQVPIKFPLRQRGKTEPQMCTTSVHTCVLATENRNQIDNNGSLLRLNINLYSSYNSFSEYIV